MSPNVILLVEDNRSDEKLAIQAFKRCGVPNEVVVVRDGVEALEYLHAKGDYAARDASATPALMLLDLKMPRIDGLEVLKRARADPRTCLMPIVILTASIEDEDLSLAYQLGANAYVRKPVDFAEFASAATTIAVFWLSLNERAPEGSRTMTGLLRVLLVEDSPTDAKLVLHALRATGREIQMERVENAEAMREALARGGWDLVISDWSLPQFSGASALAVLQASGLDVPFVLVSGTVGEETAVEAMRAGAHDYVLKDRLSRLAPVVERELRDAVARATARAADAEVRQQAARFRALIERSDDGITLLNAEQRILYASPGARRIFGWQSDEGLSTSIVALVHPDDRARLAEPLGGSPSAGASLEFRILRSDGAVRWLDATLSNRLDDPDVAAVVVNFRDTTDRQTARARLQESEMRFRRLWDSGIVGVAVTETSGAYLDANDALLEIIGHTREDLEAGRVRWDGMTPPDWVDSTAAALLQLSERGIATPWEKEYVRKDGSRAPVLVAIAALGPTRNLTLVVDLSAQKRAEQSLRVTEAQLRHAQKMEAVGRLAGGIAHDFNNLLSVILCFGTLAAADLPEGDPLRDDMEEICNAGRRAAELTNQLLVFSRRQVVEPKLLDLNEVLLSMDKMLRRVLGEDIALVSVLSPTAGRVFADATNIEQVVMNLAVNARDAMPTGGQLTIETATVLLDTEFARLHVGVETGQYVMLAVTDTGHGMDAATQANIFEPFFTTKPIGKGTGLGLSTVFGIVQQSGGTVWVYSEVGTGTSFKVYLPLAKADAAPVEAVEPAPNDTRGSETILLAEDDASVRAVARSLLERAGYHVIEACNAGEALLHAEQFKGTIDLLLTDVVMPQMSGPALAKRLAIMRPDMKLLCMSGYTDDSVVRHGVVDSTIAYLQKPLTPSGLRSKVREVLDAKKRR